MYLNKNFQRYLFCIYQFMELIQAEAQSMGKSSLGEAELYHSVVKYALWHLNNTTEGWTFFF